MIDFPLRTLSRTILVLFLFCSAYRPCAAGAAEPVSEPKAGAGGTAAEKAGGSAAQATPGGAQTPQVDADALKTACKQAVTDLGTGDVGLKALPDTKRTTVIQHQSATRLFTCLAIAEDKSARCDALPKQGKGECAAQFQVARELKGVPKERVKAQLIYRSCLPNAAKADCEAARDAIMAGDPAKCKGAKGVNPDFCAALASGDAAKCGALQGAERDLCSAYVTEDPKRCPKDSGDCQLVVSTFAKLKKEGLDGMQDIDPTLAAVSKGKAACAPLMSEFEKFCATVQ